MNMAMCPQIWICPGCGARVHLPTVSFAQTKDFTGELCDRLARFMCGCYVRGLSDTQIGLLLASMLLVGLNDPDEEAAH